MHGRCGMITDHAPTEETQLRKKLLGPSDTVFGTTPSWMGEGGTGHS